jgi:HAD superfamily hydrolase (TIGR01450 family)
VKLTDRFDAFLVDLDGVVWRGEEAIAGASETVEMLREMGKRVVFVTNNASKSPREYAVKLMRLRIPTDPADVVTSAHAVVESLRSLRLHRGDRIHVCAAPGLSQVLRGHGFTPTREIADAKALVVAWNPRLTFDDIRKAADLARGGVPFIGANRDATYPSESGLLPGTGAILAAIETASGRTAVVVGKPQPGIFRIALHRAAVDPSRALFVGDRPDTDVAGARAAGLPVALVLTGVTGESELGSLSDRPDVILGSLADVLTTNEPSLERGAPVVERGDPSSRAALVSAENEDQDGARDEPTDVSEVSDPTLFSGLTESGSGAEELNEEPHPEHDPSR